jgi:HAE1 family hydrophobic/amphiphilic exporter-1
MWLLAFGSLFGALAMIATQSVGSSFLPEADSGGIQVEITAPSGSSLEYTRIKAEQAAALARAMPEVEYTQTTVGSDGNVSKAEIYVDFIKQSDRERSAKQIAQAVRADIRRLVGAEFTVADNSTTAQKPLQIGSAAPAASSMNWSPHTWAEASGRRRRCRPFYPGTQARAAGESRSRPGLEPGHLDE